MQRAYLKAVLGDTKSISRSATGRNMKNMVRSVGLKDIRVKNILQENVFYQAIHFCRFGNVQELRPGRDKHDGNISKTRFLTHMFLSPSHMKKLSLCVYCICVNTTMASKNKLINAIYTNV